MGRVEPVKLQLRTAEVWLTTSGGSATMVGASHKQDTERVNSMRLKGGLEVREVGTDEW